jgi:hypothetical protein
MRIEYPISNYTKAEAYTKIDTFLDNLVKEHSGHISDPEKKWNGNKDIMDFSFKAMSFKTSGNIKLLDGKVVLDGSLPFLARAISGTIEKTIKTELKKLFP